MKCKAGLLEEARVSEVEAEEAEVDGLRRTRPHSTVSYMAKVLVIGLSSAHRSWP